MKNKIAITSLLLLGFSTIFQAQVLITNDNNRIETDPSTNFGLEIDPKDGLMPLKVTDFPYKQEPTAGSKPLIVDENGKVKKLVISKTKIPEVLHKQWNVNDYNNLQSGVTTILPPFGGRPNANFSDIGASLTGCLHSGSKTIPLLVSGSASTNCSELANGNTKLSGYSVVPNTDFNLNVNYAQKILVHAFIFGHVIPTYIDGSLTAAIPNFGYTTAALLNASYKREWLNTGRLTGNWENHGGSLSYTNKTDRLYQTGSEVNYAEEGGPMALYEIIYSTDNGTNWQHSGITCHTRYVKGIPIRLTLAGGIDIPANTNVQFKVIYHYRFPYFAQQTLNGVETGELNDNFKLLINSINILVESKKEVDLL